MGYSFLNSTTIIDKVLRDSLSNKQANADYSVTEGKFYIQPPVTHNYLLTGFWIKLVVAADISADGYGDGAALTNGIKVTLEDSSGTELHDFLDGDTIKSNADWGRIVDFDTIIPRESGDAYLTGDAYFLASYGAPIKLFGEGLQRFVLTFQDDLTVVGATNAMVAHEFGVMGGQEAITC